MVQATLKRIKSDEHGTFGELYVVDERICYTLEPPDNGNEEDNSCIPAGKYIVKKYKSERHGNVYAVQDVPDRTGILFHRGNLASDTKGCIMVGEDLGILRGTPAILGSRTAWALLKARFTDEEFELNIIKCYDTATTPV